MSSVYQHDGGLVSIMKNHIALLSGMSHGKAGKNVPNYDSHTAKRIRKRHLFVSYAKTDTFNHLNANDKLFMIAQLWATCSLPAFF